MLKRGLDAFKIRGRLATVIEQGLPRLGADTRVIEVDRQFVAGDEERRALQIQRAITLVAGLPSFKKRFSPSSIPSMAPQKNAPVSVSFENKMG